MKRDELRTLMEHTLLDIPIEKHDAKDASNKLIANVWPVVEDMRAEAAAAERKTQDGGATRVGMVTAGGAE